MSPHSSSLTITNPLVLYRSLIATNRIKPDPAQHRLALHLQKIYERLMSYEPAAEYSPRLNRLIAITNAQDVFKKNDAHTSTLDIRGLWNSLRAQKEKRESLALTRVLTSHEAVMDLQTPKGLMLHGEVGTGKSMLLDLFAHCLPKPQKRRWHFNTFMLDMISRLEAHRKSCQSTTSGTARLEDEYSLLWLARDLIQTSPILFLDEFQLPDRVASKILANLMTSFFQLGGVLIATSNRMPEELAKAAGTEFVRPVGRHIQLGWNLRMNGMTGKDNGPGQKGEYAQFLEVLRSRCEVWEMEGRSDYRRFFAEGDRKEGASSNIPISGTSAQAIHGFYNKLTHERPTNTSSLDFIAADIALPKNYLIIPQETHQNSGFESFWNNLLHTVTMTPVNRPIPWRASCANVYGRQISITAQHEGIAMFNFSQICGTTLGPADYLTVASKYHTIILTDVPVLGLSHKNEARRFITLLDALYEAQCRLLMTAIAGPDDIFFPEPKASLSSMTVVKTNQAKDAVHAETYSEIHQDLTSPFLPNVSSYSTPSLSSNALEDDPPNRVQRTNSSYLNEPSSKKIEDVEAPDFANIRGLTGEDELFAVKRAESRIWEMCSGKWWNRGVSNHASSTKRLGEKDVMELCWWHPLPIESRHWEQPTMCTSDKEKMERCVSEAQVMSAETNHVGGDNSSTNGQPDLFSHSISPFRTTKDPPPRIDWTHIWGTVKWGKRAGAWGKGVEGLEEKKREEERRATHVGGNEESRNPD